METFRHLNNRLHGTAEDLPTPVGLPQQFERHIGEDSANIKEDVDKTSKKSPKLDDPIKQ